MKYKEVYRYQIDRFIGGLCRNIITKTYTRYDHSFFFILIVNSLFKITFKI